MRRKVLFLIVPLILFSAPMHSLAATRDEGIIAEAPLSEYAGSKSCSECHKERYETWAKRLKANFVRYLKDIEDPLPFKWEKSPIKKHRVFIVVGKERKFAFVDKKWTVLPYEFRLNKGRWVKRKGWAKNRFDYRVRCAPCHTTGSNPKRKNFKELSVGCEACHGPSKTHNISESIKDITVPGRGGEDPSAQCRRCHNSRKNHARALEDFNGTFHK